jgi:putative hemolysin
MDILLIVFLTLVNAVFAMSEMSVAASRRNRLVSLAEDHAPGARKALDLVDRPTEFLSTVQVGITSIGLLNGIVGEAAFSGPLSAQFQGMGLSPSWASAWATTLVVVGITFFTIVFGELVPKRIGQMYPETIARWLAPTMSALAWATKPFVRLLAGSTAAILRVLRLSESADKRMTSQDVSISLDEAVGHGAIEAEEHQVVSNVFRLDERPLTSFMTPRADVVWLEGLLTVDQALALIREQPLHSWYLVAKGSMDHVTGVISLSTLIQHPERSAVIDGLTEPALYLPETLTGLDLLNKLKLEAERGGSSSKRGLGRLACVVDEYR